MEPASNFLDGDPPVRQRIQHREATIRLQLAGNLSLLPESLPDEVLRTSTRRLVSPDMDSMNPGQGFDRGGWFR